MTENILGNKSTQDLADYIARIESLTEEKAEVAERIKAEYAAAAGDGFDKKALRQLVKERAADGDKTIGLRETVEVYRKALAGLAGTPLGDWARTWVAEDTRMKQRKEEASSVLDEFLQRAKEKNDDDEGDDE